MKYITYLENLCYFLKFEVAHDKAMQLGLSDGQASDQELLSEKQALLQSDEDSLIFIPPFVIEHMENRSQNSDMGDISGVSFVQGFTFE